MGRIGRLIQAAIGEFIVQTVEAYKGANLTAETFAPSGDDSPPLPDDRVVLVQVDGTGSFVAVGVLSRSQGAKPGERILYSRDEDGEVRAALRLLGDGTVEIKSADENGDVQAVFSIGGNGGLKLTDKSGNSVEMSSSGMTLTDAKGGKVEMAGKITVQGLSGKLEVS